MARGAPAKSAADTTPTGPAAGRVDRLTKGQVVRGGFHATNALWGVLAYHFIVPKWLAASAIGALAVAWTVVEVLRVRSPRLNAQVLDHRFLGRIIRGHEHGRVSGAAFFLWGVFLSIALFPKPATEVGCLVMGFGDPAAVLVGSRWGRRRPFGRRSLEGAFAFLAAALTATFAFRALAYPAVGLSWTLGLCALVALVGAVAELSSERVDDNLTVPVLASAAATLYLAAVPGG